MENSHWQKMANLVFDLEKKTAADSTPALQRICQKMKQVIEESGIFLYNPLGERYTETRTDVDANISGMAGSDLVIKEVIKPILYTEDGGRRTLLQKGVVVAGAK